MLARSSPLGTLCFLQSRESNAHIMVAKNIFIILPEFIMWEFKQKINFLGSHLLNI